MLVHRVYERASAPSSCTSTYSPPVSLLQGEIRSYPVLEPPRTCVACNLKVSRIVPMYARRMNATSLALSVSLQKTPLTYGGRGIRLTAARPLQLHCPWPVDHSSEPERSFLETPRLVPKGPSRWQAVFSSERIMVRQWDAVVNTAKFVHIK